MVQLALKNSELWDESYAQLCMQTTSNEAENENVRGWELLAISSQTYPPSAALEALVTAHFAAAAEHETVGRFAKLCTANLTRILQCGAVLVAPPKQWVEAIASAPSRTPVFGTCLTDLIVAQDKKYPDEEVPHIVSVLISSMLKAGKAKPASLMLEDGIENVDANRIAKMRWLFDIGLYDLDGDESLQELLALFVSWIDACPTALLSEDLAPAILEACDHKDTAKAAIAKLPKSHRDMLEALVSLMKGVYNIAASIDTEDNTKATISRTHLARFLARMLLKEPEVVEKESIDGEKAVQLLLSLAHEDAEELPDGDDEEEFEEVEEEVEEEADEDDEDEDEE